MLAAYAPSCVALTCILTLAGSQFAGAFYHMTSEAHACRVMAAENATVDLVCQYHDVSRGGASLPCVARTIWWQRVDLDVATNVSDSSKYGIWEAVPGWGLEEGRHISLLKVRHVQPEDVGRYQCRILCQGPHGLPRTEFHTADLCLQQPNSKYSICGTHISSSKCVWSFKNDKCDADCDNEESLFDSFECESDVSECAAEIDDECRRIYANGVCDPECESVGCGWDGGDCIDQPLKFVDDTIVLTLARWYQMSGKTINVKHLGRSLSKLLHTVVRVLPDDWQGEHMAATGATTVRPQQAMWHRPDRAGYDAARKIYLKLDNTMCRGRCFKRAETAARFIAMALRDGWDPYIPVSAIGVLGHSTNKCSLGNNTLLHIELPSDSNNKDHNIYSYSTARKGEGGGGEPPMWVLVVAVSGGVLTLILICIIIFIVHRIRKLSTEERRREEIQRIHMDKSVVPGTDV